MPIPKKRPSKSRAKEPSYKSPTERTRIQLKRAIRAERDCVRLRAQLEKAIVRRRQKLYELAQFIGRHLGSAHERDTIGEALGATRDS